MLPGTRAYSDEDITEVMVDSLALFNAILENNDVPELAIPTLLQTVINMVSQRQIPPRLLGDNPLPKLSGQH